MMSVLAQTSNKLVLKAAAGPLSNVVRTSVKMDGIGSLLTNLVIYFSLIRFGELQFKPLLPTPQPM